MNFLAKHLIEQIKGKTIAVFGGGFKPPTKGHFGVVKQALEQNPEIDEFRIFVGTGERGGITQSQSVLIWEIYNKYLPFKVQIIPSEVAPIKAIYDTAKENPQDEVLWVIGARDGNEEDFNDIAKRTASINKYPNLELRTIISKNGTSGTAARNAMQQQPEKLFSFLPDVLSDKEKQEVLNILSSSPINELLEQDDMLSLEVINPDGETFDYKEDKNFKGIYTYEDSMGNLYFARISFQPVDVPYFEFKVGWFKDNDIQKPKYEPQLPPNTTSRDNIKRRNTVAKIYRDEILPFFKKNQNLSDKLIVIPMSNSRHIFSQRLLLRHTPSEFKVEQNPTDLVVSLKENSINEVTSKELVDFFQDSNELFGNIKLYYGKHFRDRVNRSDHSFKLTKQQLDRFLDAISDHKDTIISRLKTLKKVKDTEEASKKSLVIYDPYTDINMSVIKLDNPNDPNDENSFAATTILKTPDFKSKGGRKYIMESINSIDYKQKIVELTKYMLKQGKNIKPLPKVIFKNNSQESEDFFGKTAYYQPDTQTIVLYVKDRHPKDIVRSFSHEMIHHIQNLENRLGNISTTNTNEDDDLDKIEREAYLDGNMTFRNWTDTFVGDQMLKENYDDYKKFGKDIVIQAYDYFDEAYPIDKNKVNLSNSIHFISKQGNISRNKQRIRNVIFKQLMEAYRGTSLESFNKKHKFTPNFGGFQVGGWEAPHAYFSFSPYFYKYGTDGEERTIEGFFSAKVTYATGEEAYDVENDFISQAANNIGPILDPNFTEKPTGNNKNPELDAVLEVAPVTFIPFIEAPAESDVKDDELTSSHQSKKLWKDIFNDLGLQCISLEKDPEWKMDNPQLTEKKDPFGLTAYARELALLRENENYKLFLDMDGVVADFNKRFEDLAGMTSKEFENKYGKNAFWEFIDEGDNKIRFWVGIEPMPGAQKLVSYIAKNFGYEMLTAPSLKKQSRLGKSLWIRNWTNKGLFPSKPKINFKFAKNKQDFAAPNHILVDDKKSTIDQWNAAGGIGILYQSAEQVIKDLEDVKKRIQ